MNRNKYFITALILGAILFCSLVLTGCKKKSEQGVPAETKEAVSAVIEQATCPVMGGAIDKNVFTEYKGKKVYFCCPGCVEKFNEDPEKYIGKLPQFKE
jgi:YHS domain-containing protein